MKKFRLGISTAIAAIPVLVFYARAGFFAQTCEMCKDPEFDKNAWTSEWAKLFALRYPRFNKFLAKLEG